MFKETVHYQLAIECGDFSDCQDEAEYWAAVEEYALNLGD